MSERSPRSRGAIAGGLATACVTALGLGVFAAQVAVGPAFLDPTAGYGELAAVCACVLIVSAMIGGFAGRWGAGLGRPSSGVWVGLVGGGVLALLPALATVEAVANDHWTAFPLTLGLTTLGPIACAVGGWVGGRCGQVNPPD
jgi:hypothetical protein